MSIFDKLIKIQQQLMLQLEQLQSSIHCLPEGKLLCSNNSKQTKWYLSHGSTPIYIPKKDFALAQSLVLKKYYQLQFDELSHQLQILTRSITYLQRVPRKSEQLLSSNSPYHDLLIKSFQSLFNATQWAHEPYHTNTKYPEGLIHKCISGLMVRSKSEEIIANSLISNQIPFRYECELAVDNAFLYPDFTILHPTSNQIYYWEHFGLMDNSNYRDNTFNKLKLYGNNNIIPSINLITTYETTTHPIDSVQIQDIIDKYFK